MATSQVPPPSSTHISLLFCTLASLKSFSLRLGFERHLATLHHDHLSISRDDCYKCHFHGARYYGGSSALAFTAKAEISRLQS